MGETPTGIDSSLRTGVNNQDRKELPPMLTWSDMLFLAKSNWGLRHVSTKDQALKEKTTGIEWGDGVSITAVTNLYKFIQNPNPEIVELISQLGPANASEVLDSMCSGTEKQQIIDQFSSRLQQFIGQSIGIDINHLESVETSTIQEILAKMGEGPSFIVAKFNGADYPYDKNEFYGLGKCGKQAVPKENIIAVITPPAGTVVKSGFNAEEMDQTINRDSFEALRQSLSGFYWKQFVGTVKGVNEQKR